MTTPTSPHHDDHRSKFLNQVFLKCSLKLWNEELFGSFERHTKRYKMLYNFNWQPIYTSQRYEHTTINAQYGNQHI